MNLRIVVPLSASIASKSLIRSQRAAASFFDSVPCTRGTRTSS